MARRPYTQSVDPESGRTIHNISVPTVKLVLALIGQALATCAAVLSLLWVLAEPKVNAAVKAYDKQEIEPRLERRFSEIDREREEQNRRFESTINEIKDDVKWLVRAQKIEGERKGR
jgi:hypothetical protein